MCKVYHYTIKSNFEKIMETKVLKLATKGINANEKPVLWFSSNPYWENTATKLICDAYGDILRAGTMEDMYAFGMYRFVIDSSKTLPFKRLRKLAKISSKRAVFLKEAGKHMGGNHKEWCGMCLELDVSECISIEKMVNKKWVPIN